MLTADLLRDVKVEEGLRLKAGADTVGVVVGYGRNLTTNGLTQAEAEYLLANDVARTLADLEKYCAWWLTLDDVRQEVVADMAFELGVGGLLLFRDMLFALGRRQYDVAADAMLDSLWARQVPSRAQRLAAMMRTGTKSPLSVP